METKRLSKEQVEQLCKPLPKEAIKKHPTKNYLSAINSIFVTERLNEVFGVGAWQLRTERTEVLNKMVVCKVVFTVPEYGIYYECFGGNDNADFGDAHKGATTDALTKIGSWLGIGTHVWKNNPYPEEHVQPDAPAPQKEPAPALPQLTMKILNEKAAQWKDWGERKGMTMEQVIDAIGTKYDLKSTPTVVHVALQTALR